MQLPDQQTDEITDLVAMGQDGRVRYTRKQRARVLELREMRGTLSPSRRWVFFLETSGKPHQAENGENRQD
jgi:hypothetical protein